MNGHDQRRNPHAPFDGLWLFSRQGVPAPPGYAFNQAGDLVQLAYQPWQNTLQLPWESFDNPVYQSFAQNNSTVEIQPGVDPTAGLRYGKDPQGRAVPPLTAREVALVPQEEYLTPGGILLPTQDNGTLALTGVGERGAVARINYRIAKSLISYTEVPSSEDIFPLAILDPTQPPPLSVPAAQASYSAPPIGAAVSIAMIGFGHKGAQFQSFYDVPPGQIIHVPFSGSFGETNAMLAPKYYTPSTEPITGFRTYLLFPAGPFITNNNWNLLTQDILGRNGGLSSTVGGPPNPNKAPFMGWFAEAFSFSNTTFSQPTRRFYGSVMATPVVPNPLAMPPVGAASITVCPVAWFSSQVTLVGNAGLNFVVRAPPIDPVAGVPQLLGPFPANTPIELPNNARQILVFPTVDLTQAGINPYEVPFEVVYTLSF